MTAPHSPSPHKSLNDTSLDDLKSEFISTVSHELRTPLTSIGGYVQLIQAGDAGPITDTQREFLSIIQVNVRRLNSLINDLLDIEKLEAGGFEFRKEPQDLRELLRECRDSLALMAQKKGLELKIDIPSDVPPILGDRGRMVQIFNNLLSNAIKYTNTGFVEILVRTDARGPSHEPGVAVQVRDTGVGLSSFEKDQLFKKFYRTDSSLASAEKGTGLGLAITKGLVKSHGGAIRVESELGKGSTFEVFFPVTAPVMQASEVAQGQAAELIRAIEEVDANRIARETEFPIEVLSQVTTTEGTSSLEDGSSEDANDTVTEASLSGTHES
jgi:signal transduction histidine kinase